MQRRRHHGCGFLPRGFKPEIQEWSQRTQDLHVSILMWRAVQLASVSMLVKAVNSSCRVASRAAAAATITVMHSFSYLLWLLCKYDLFKKHTSLIITSCEALVAPLCAAVLLCPLKMEARWHTCLLESCHSARVLIMPACLHNPQTFVQTNTASKLDYSNRATVVLLIIIPVQHHCQTWLFSYSRPTACRDQFCSFCSLCCAKTLQLQQFSCASSKNVFPFKIHQ